MGPRPFPRKDGFECAFSRSTSRAAYDVKCDQWLGRPCNLKPESMRTYVTLVSLVSFYFIIMAGNFEEELLDDSVIDIRTIEFQLFMFEPMPGSSNDSDRLS